MVMAAAAAAGAAIATVGLAAKAAAEWTERGKARCDML